jgi:hypothetical protein
MDTPKSIESLDRKLIELVKTPSKQIDLDI